MLCSLVEILNKTCQELTNLLVLKNLILLFRFGFIVMDGNGALFGTLQGNTRDVLHKFTVDLPKKHGRGGQSGDKEDEAAVGRGGDNFWSFRSVRIERGREGKGREISVQRRRRRLSFIILHELRRRTIERRGENLCEATERKPYWISDSGA